jgi:hypothetical protein
MFERAAMMEGIYDLTGMLVGVRVVCSQQLEQ